MLSQYFRVLLKVQTRPPFRNHKAFSPTRVLQHGVGQLPLCLFLFRRHLGLLLLTTHLEVVVSLSNSIPVNEALPVVCAYLGTDGLIPLQKGIHEFLSVLLLLPLLKDWILQELLLAQVHHTVELKQLAGYVLFAESRLIVCALLHLFLRAFMQLVSLLCAF